MTAQIIRGNALTLPLADQSVDLVVTSPPYFGLRSYQDAGEHYDGQIGAEATPAEFVDALIAATREMVRVLKPAGSIWVNLGDKYAQPGKGERNRHGSGSATLPETGAQFLRSAVGQSYGGIAGKSLMGIPWRYALRCIDDLGLILRAEVIWSKPNGLPESVTDRVRRSHETWFHFTREPRYYSAVDEIREPHTMKPQRRLTASKPYGEGDHQQTIEARNVRHEPSTDGNPLGKLPGSVWSIPTQPLRVPAELGIDHFAAFPMEWPRRIIQGWSPAGVCTGCGEGRRPVITKGASFPADLVAHRSGNYGTGRATTAGHPTGNHAQCSGQEYNAWRSANPDQITAYACACPDTTAPTRPAVVLDPFGGTGTTALLAKTLGRHGISIDMSSDYCRLAKWRTTDEAELAGAMQVDKPAKQVEGQATLFEGIG